MKGFLVRPTSASARAFARSYRAEWRPEADHSRLGSAPDWADTHDRAKELKRLLHTGEDAIAECQESRLALTVAALADRFEAEHVPKLQPTTAKDYRSMLRAHIRPRLGNMKVADLRRSDIERLHQPVLVNQNPCAQARCPRDMILQGWATSLFQA